MRGCINSTHHALHKSVNKFQHFQLIFRIFGPFLVRFGADNEEETSVTSVDDFVATIFQERALRFAATQAFANDFRLERRSFIHGYPFVVGRITGLAHFIAAK